MSEPFLAEVRIVGFNFAPRGWALCDGQLLPIAQNQSLYSLLGTIYGGDGRETFALPDLRGRTPIHMSGGHRQGQKGGQETVALSAAQMPSHTHQLRGVNDAATASDPAGNLWATARDKIYLAPSSTASPAAMAPDAVPDVGGGQAHNNMQPYLTLNFIIALRGLFPSRN